MLRRRRSGPVTRAARHLNVTSPPPSCECAAAHSSGFGRPSNYSLSRAELERHIQRLGWQPWENAVRFDFSFWDAA